MAVNVEAVLMVLLGVLALSAPAGLSRVLFRVLVKPVHSREPWVMVSRDSLVWEERPAPTGAGGLQ